MPATLARRLANAAAHADAIQADGRYEIVLRVGNIGIIVDVVDSQSQFAIDRIVSWPEITDGDVNPIVEVIDMLIKSFPQPS